MSGISADESARLAELLSEESGLLDGFLELTRLQTEILEQNDADTDALMDNLCERRKWMEKIDGLHQELDVLMQAYASCADGASGGGAGREAIDRTRGEIRGKLVRAEAMDKRNRELAQKQAAFFKEELQKSKLSRRTLGAYYQNEAGTNAEYFDKLQ